MTTGVDTQRKEVLKNKNFMPGMIYAQTSTRITMESHTRDKALKKTERGHVDDQDSVRAVVEQVGGLLEGLTCPPGLDQPSSETFWNQLRATPGELRIGDMDFTDLRDEDDLDILDMDNLSGSGDLLPPPPGGSFLSRCTLMPPPPPLAGPTPPPSPQKKRKTIRLFWNEVCPVGLQRRRHGFPPESLWSRLEPVELDTSRLERLFESKSKELPVTRVRLRWTAWYYTTTP